MRLNYIFSALSLVLICFGIMVFIPIFVALYFHEYSSLTPFIYSGIISVLSGLILKHLSGGKQNYNNLKKKEGLFIVAITWIAISIIAALPFLFFGVKPIDAIFEGVASITTTGATILSNYTFPKTLFFWCSFSEWLGGMGVIVLFIAILPQFAVAGRQLFFAEVPGPTEDKITPRIKQTAAALWGIYIALTIIEIIVLKLSGMPLFTSICNSFATISASGFSYNQVGSTFLHSHFIMISTIFMFLAGVNFSLQYRIIVQKQFKALKNSTEFMTYLYLILIVSILITLALIFVNQYEIIPAIKSAFYQVISIITSTGTTLPDFSHWSKTTKILLFILMLIGGSAGSTSGGIKVVRIVILFKYLWREIIKILHPQAILQIKLGKSLISDDVLKQILAFVIFYFLILLISSITVCAIENNITLGIMGSASTLGNISPVFSYSGAESFDTLSPFTKIIFAINMLVGRLELIPFIAMLHSDFWKFTLKKES